MRSPIEAVAALQETAKGAADQISDLQRQLRLLSEQVGALAARVDSLAKPGNPLDAQAWALEGSDTLNRSGDWTIAKNDAVITLYSGTQRRREAPVNDHRGSACA
jgi:hypothetical protein